MTSDQGLSSKEAAKRLKLYGHNSLPEKKPPSNFAIFLSQLKNPFVYILVVAGVITISISHTSDAVIIFSAVGINTILGFLQERRASKALHELKKLIHPSAIVIRDGERKKIDALNIVPGDLIVINYGDKIAADGVLVKAEKLFIDESILTGESVPVAKKDQSDASMGTVVTSGHGLMEVVKTGKDTKMGAIAERIQEPGEDTPLRIQLKKLSKQLSLLVFGLTAFVFVVGSITGRDLLSMFLTSVSLAVSAIPEGLLVGLTVVLAIGMQRILSKKGLVRNLVSAETLGGVTTICVDKTGTLTAGKMQVVSFVGSQESLATQAIVANDLDDPVVIAAHEWAKAQFSKPGQATKLAEKHHRLDSIPFSSKNKFFASLNKFSKKENTVYVNGAPEVVLAKSNLTNKEKQAVIVKVDELSEKGRRVVALAKKTTLAKKQKLDIKDVDGLSWVGLLAFSDPVRGGVREAFVKTRKAGIKTLVITGDYPATAVSVMRQLDFEVGKDQIVLGSELKNMTHQELSKRLKNPDKIKLFARTDPEQKLKIVEALKENGEVVAMMGDGVNDAPALKKSDIGIVVGEASDVAKETADLVLLDSSFTTIVEAIEEGRGIFDNIRKIILYLMSDAFEEIIAVVGTLILGLPLPVTAGQILWINLVSDGFPDLALTVDPKVKGIMSRGPRSPEENIVAGWMRELILVVSVVGGIFALGLFVYFFKTTGDELLARSIAFSTLGLNSLVYVFSIRTLKEPFWRENPFDNKWLNLAVLVGLLFQVGPFLLPQTRQFLRIVPLSISQWGLVFSASLTMFVVIELLKFTINKKRP